MLTHLLLGTLLGCGELQSGPGSVSVQNLRLAAAEAPAITGPFVGSLVEEEIQAGTDLNGDGADYDGDWQIGFNGILHVYDGHIGVVATGRVLAAQLRRVRPNAAGVLVIGSEPDSVSLFGGTLLVAGPFLGTVTFSTLRLGFDSAARVNLGVLPGELAGEALYLQAGVIDPSAKGGVALSRGLRVVVGG